MRVAPFLRLLPLVLVASPIASCGGSAEGGPRSVPLADVPASFAKATCDAVDTCLGPLAPAILGTSDCFGVLTKQIEQGDFSLIQGGVDAGTITYDGTKAQACADAISSGGCKVLATRFSVLCSDLAHGSKKSGADCTFNAECSPGLFCEMTAACPGACNPFYTEGHACTEDDQCADGLSCKDATCQKPKGFQVTGAEGDTCDPNASDLCKEGLVCALVSVVNNVTSWKCETPSDGTTCRLALPESCPDGKFCKITDAQTFEGTCEAVPGEGDACAERYQGDTSPACPPETTCVSGTCKGRENLGAVCGSDTECYSKHCVNGKCAATKCSE